MYFKLPVSVVCIEFTVCLPEKCDRLLKIEYTGKDCMENRNSTNITNLVILFSFLLSAGADVSQAEENVAIEKITFSKHVLPILSNKCFQCHGPDKKTREANLRLDDYNSAIKDLGGYAAIVPGNLEKSELHVRINDPEAPMPPVETKLTLSDREKEILSIWIKSGGEYSAHWSFVTPQRPALPLGNFGRNPIDAFVGHKLKSQNLGFSKEATPQKLIRRVTLDLTGLPPTIAEVKHFVDDYAKRGEPAYSDLVDRLLKSPRYGETMALPWLDAARFADTDGYQYDGPRFQWRWRDWVINAYNSNMPFDQFTIEQLAGDLLENPSYEQLIATGFNRNHRYNSEAGLVVEEFLLENAVDRVDTTSTLWMGLTMGCARCHDHKYDPISQKDYYQLIAFFNNIPEAGRAVKGGNSEPVSIAPTASQQKILAQKEKAVEDAFAQLKPGDEIQQGGPLVDRKLVHQFLLNKKGEKNTKLIGDATIEDNALILDGNSTCELGGINKKVTLHAQTRFSISLWVKPDNLQNAFIFSRQNPSITRPGIELSILENGKLQYDQITRWLAGTARAVTNQKIEKGKWVHIAIVNDGSMSANGIDIYLNGKKTETTIHYNTNSNTGGSSTNRPIVLGGGVRKGPKNFTGAIKDFRLYSTNLWPEEIDILSARYGGEKRVQFSGIKMQPGYKTYVSLREELDKYRKTLPTVMVMKENPVPKPTYLRNRGVYNSYGKLVERNVPEKLPPMDPAFPKNRLGFAKWLVSPNHPLTARVAVNRYWQKYFGRGLVKTAEDFGIQGEPPSHPKLLDFLAVEFIESGWNVAHMQKLIVTSKTYRQQSNITKELYNTDPKNILLARGPRLRLSGHVLRDQALFSSGLLKERVGGPSVSPYQPANLWAEMSMGMRYKISKGDDLYRRSLYTIWKRTVAPPSLAVFDSADRESCTVNRKTTNTPLQALTLLNEQGFVENARNLAERMLKEGENDPIGFGFQSLTSRMPNQQERDILNEALKEYLEEFGQAPDKAKKLISIGNSKADGSIPASQLAAYTSLANILLNLDEVINRE